MKLTPRELRSLIREMNITTEVPKFHFDTATDKYISSIRDIVQRAIVENAAPEDDQFDMKEKIDNLNEALEKFKLEVLEDLDNLLALIDL